MSLTDEQRSNRVKWIRALLSGDYKQGRRALKRLEDEYGNATGGPFYCCLGVACEVVIPSSESISIPPFNVMASAMMMPNEADMFGMTPADQSCAARWNDRTSFSFKQIADMVAYATEHDLSFEGIDDQNVPDDYATEWLSTQS